MPGEFIAGSVVGKMILDRTQWKKSTKEGEKEAKGLSGAIEKHGAGIRKVGMAMTAVGGAIVGTLGLMIKQYVAAGDEVHKMAQRTGFSTETLSELRYAAEISGASIASLEKGVKKMSKTILDAGDGLTTYVRAFKRIGIEVKELEGLSPEEQFMKIGLAIAAVEDPTTRAAAAVDIFGRAGTQLLPLFNQGVSGINELRQAAHELGIVFDQEAANKAARLADAQVTLRESMKGVSKSIAETFVPILADMAEKAAKVISKVTKWIQENPKLAKTIIKIVAGLGALMLVLGPLAIVLPSLVAGVGMLAGAFVGIIAPIAAVTAAVGVAAVTFLKLKSAKDAARKASENYEKNIVKLKNKLNEARKEAGLSAAEWNKMVKAYKGNYAAMAMAIHKGKEGVEMQKALKKVSQESKEAYDKQKESTIKLGESFTGVYQKQKTWVDYIKSIGLTTIEQKRQRVEELEGYIRQLKQAHEEGKISTEVYTEAVKKAKDEIRGYSEELGVTAIPKTREMTGVLEQATPWLASMADNTDVAKQHLREFAAQMGMTSAEVQIGGYNMMATFMNMAGIGMPKISLAAKETRQVVTNEWTQMADGIKTKWITNFSDVLKGSKTIGEGIKGIFGGIKDQFIDMTSKMLAEWSLKFVVGILKGGKGILSGLTDIFKGVGGFFSSLFGKGAGGVAGAAEGVTGAVTGLTGAISGMWTGVGAAVGTFLGGILGGGQEKHLRRMQRDMLWWTEKIFMVLQQNILGELYKIKDERLGAFFPKIDTMLNEFYQIRDAAKGILKALTSQGTVYVDVFRSAIFDSVGEKITSSMDTMGTDITSSIGSMEAGLGGAISGMGHDIGGAISGMGSEMGGAIKGIHIPEFDAGRFADEFAKRMPEAQMGGVLTRPGPIMTHGTIADPEFIGTAKQLGKMGIAGGPSTVHVHQTVNLNGKMITTREYTREEIIPEMLEALDANVKKSDFQEKLGIK